MYDGPDTITRPLPFKIGKTSLTCEMQYSTFNPYELRFEFTDDQDASEWVVGRDLVAGGLDSESWYGIGDFQLRRGSHDTMQVAIFTRVDDREVMAVLTDIPRRPLVDFIRRTFKMVDAGQEENWIDWVAFDQARVMW